MAPLIVLTCAGGKQVKHILPHLAKQDVSLRLIVNSESSAQRLKQQYPEAQVEPADLIDPKLCKHIARDATTIFHLGPPLHPFEAQIGFNMIEAALTESRKPDSHFKHFILSTTLWPQLRKLPHHVAKSSVEEYLIESGVPFTIMQPSVLFDNLPAKLLAQNPEPVMPVFFNADTPISFAALHDVGEVSAKVILEGKKHFYAEYQITSTFPMTNRELAAELGRQLGKTVKVQQLPFEQAVKLLLGDTYGPEPHFVTKDTAERMILHVNSHPSAANPGVTKWLLGRETLSCADWLSKQLA